MNSLGSNVQQLQKMKTHPGFVAALDQSGGSTPKALRLYGIKDDAWSNEDEMFTIVHQMRSRIITIPCDSPGLSDSGEAGIMVPGGPQDERVTAGSVAS